MAWLMPRFSNFQAAILVLLISAHIVNGQEVNVNMPGPGGIGFQAGAGVGAAVPSGASTSTQPGILQGSNYIGVGVSGGNDGAGAVQPGINNGNVQQIGNIGAGQDPINGNMQQTVGNAGAGAGLDVLVAPGSNNGNMQQTGGNIGVGAGLMVAPGANNGNMQQTGGNTGAVPVVPGQGQNTGDAKQNGGNMGAEAGVSVGQGPNTGNVQQSGNNVSTPVMPGPNTAAGPVRGHRHGLRSPRPGIPIAKAREFLHAHNKARAAVNMPPFQWDNGLARYARRWASKRAADCKMLHSFGEYGENIFWAEKDVWTPTQMVESWVSENEFYDATKNVCASGQVCGHYTQVIWLDTTKVGCAKVTCLNGGMFTVCNYDPPGNFVNESPFTHFQG